MAHSEWHLVQRIGWLRAAVMGANDGIVSTASLIVGVAAAGSSTGQIVIAGLAGLVAGAMSMAAGEYVSVSSQADTEKADLARERAELETRPHEEREELTQIYVERGLDRDLASRVADQLMAHDALGAHARDELGISEVTTARPLQAALTSAVTFATGAAFPLIVAALVPLAWVAGGVFLATLISLAGLGLLGAQAGGAGRLRATGRVVLWGTLAMAATALVGTLFGAVG